MQGTGKPTDEDLPDLAWLAMVRVRLERLLGLGQDVFLSHNHDDGAKYAEALHDALAAHGRSPLSSFLDKHELAYGDSLSTEIERALHRCTALVVIGTEGAWRSSWVTDEISSYLASHRSDPRILRIAFPHAPLPEDHPHFDRLNDTLAITAQPDALTSVEQGHQPTRTADAVHSHFAFARKRARRALVIATVATLACVLAWAIYDSDRERRASLWSDRASAAEDAHRFAEGELLYAKAWSIAHREEDERAYRRCRARRAFDHVHDVELDESLHALAVVAGASGPLLVVQDPTADRVELWNRGDATTRTLHEGNVEDVDESSIATGHGWIAMKLGDKLHLHEATIAADAEQREISLSDSVVDIEVYPSSVAWLVDQDDAFVVEREAWTTHERMAPVRLDRAGLTTTHAELLRRRPGAFFAGDVSQDSVYAPYVFVWRDDLEEPWQQVFTRRAAALPQTFTASASPGGGVVCLGLSPPDPAAPLTGLTDNRDRVSYIYARLDDGHFRDFELERISLNAASFDEGPMDVYYRTENGELRCVRRPYLVVRAIQRETLATSVADFAHWRVPESSRVAFVQNGDTLGIAEDGAITYVRPIETTGAWKIRSTAHGEFLAVLAEAHVHVFRKADPKEPERVPSVEELERELGLALPDT